MAPPETTVVDQADQHRFVVSEDSVDAELVYKAEPGRLVLVHTEVPEAFRGRGIGGELVKAALARAAESGETVVPSCPYVRTWLQGHPDAAASVTVDWDA